LREAEKGLVRRYSERIPFNSGFSKTDEIRMVRAYDGSENKTHAKLVGPGCSSVSPERRNYVKVKFKKNKK